MPVRGCGNINHEPLSLFLPALKLEASGPQFNFLQGDRELIAGLNLTKNEKVYHDPVEGEANDLFRAVIYYHNGVAGEMAANTKVFIGLPKKTTENKAVISAKVSADNATVVSNTVVDGKIVGESGLTTNLDVDAYLSYIKGSAKWYPNNAGLGSAPVILPFGQSGEELFSQEGLNLGDIAGCWQYSGYVTFDYSTKKIEPVQEITISKKVRNLTLGEESFVSQTMAYTGDKVEFSIGLYNPNKISISGGRIMDLMPSSLKYIPESLAEKNYDGTFSSVDEQYFFDKGLGLKIPPEKGFEFHFQAIVDEKIQIDHSIKNMVSYENNGIMIKDYAVIDLFSTPPPPSEENVIRSKKVTNLMTGQEGTNLNANPGDELMYFLSAENRGSAPATVTIEDGVADVLEYAEVFEISDEGKVFDHQRTGNYEKIIRYPEVQINPNQKLVVKFKVKIFAEIPTNPRSGFSYDFVLYNKYGNEVCVLLEPSEKLPVLKVEKSVRNISASEVQFQKENIAFPGDRLEYMINFFNEGEGSTDDFLIRDALPPNTQYVAGSASLILNDLPAEISDDFISVGLSIKDLKGGEKGSLKFSVLTSKDLMQGEVLKNSVFLISDESTSDFAITNIVGMEAQPVPTPENQNPEMTLPQTQIDRLPRLPITGWGGFTLSLLLSLSIGTILIYRNFRLELRKSQLS